MSQETFLTDAIVARHKKEIDEAGSGGPLIVCLVNHVTELAAHAYDLEKRLHAAWNEQRWEEK